MKTILFIFLLAAFFFENTAQTLKICGSDELTQKVWDADPKIKEAHLNRLKQSAMYPKMASTPAYTIPVVFHILHQGGQENISDAQILDAIAILNRDFRKLNADTAAILAPFQAADVNFEFRLATKDTSGNCTTGIVRHYTPLTNWEIVSINYMYTWDPTKYLNFYVVKSIPGFFYAGAYAHGPGISGPPEDVIVVNHPGVGSIGSGSIPNSRGLTHEVGHWFDLNHIWGNGLPGLTCSGNDGIADTPVTKGFTVCPATTVAICNPGIAENHQNYMDYSSCKIMFTTGQATHMTAIINGTLSGRNNLWTNSNLIATGVINPASPCQLIAEAVSTANIYTLCTDQTVMFSDCSYNGTVTARSWSASGGAVITNSTAASAGIIFPTAGIQTVSLQVSNGVSLAINTKTVLVLNTVTNVFGSYIESFEANGLPANFNISNTSAVAWAQTTLAAASGNKSYFIDGSQEPVSDVNILETPSYDFLNNPGSVFTFKYAYARYSSSNTDVFKVQASICGAEWVDIYKPSNANMSSGSGGLSTAPFYPTPSQFKTYTLTDHPYFTNFLNLPNVKLRFYFKEDSISGHGNNFFLDDLNFDTPNSVKENILSKAISFKLYPNPTTSSAEINFILSDKASVNYFITDVIGRTIEKQNTITLPTGRHQFILNENKTLQTGVYLVNFSINGQIISRKLIVE